ncbi:hypothetical protein CYY_005086 [Polysphondylium violaceum]|uniref:Protein kinase domain-containing protein n=1 Tax=Polysphondylium violaceum TaxID=133409 RepID=A0A8J4PU23_9MYCE|nr:hypothetical protein CYY_005086 [Polysphondylium violaceum]
MNKISNIKLSIVGNGKVGKTTLLSTVIQNSHPEYLHNINKGYDTTKVCKEDGQEYNINLKVLWDGDTYFRPNFYSQAEVVMICYSVVNPDSFNSVLSFWYMDIKKHLGVITKVPVILCGTKIDLREDKETLTELKLKDQLPITSDQGEDLRKKIRADVFCEVSSITLQGLNDLFQHVMKTFISSGGLIPLEKYVPKIQGKTFKELLKNQSFDEVLNYIISKKINIFNEIKKEEVEFGKEIAKGASGKVYQGRYKGRDVAIKVYSKDNPSFSIDEFNREVTIMTLLDYECFTRFYGANKEDPNCPFHISELVKGGSLRDLLLSNKKLELTYPQKISIAIDIVDAMSYLHSLGVYHLDLKSGNVLIGKDLRAKVIDFGTSRAIEPAKDATGGMGTVSWMAPEIFKGQPYTESCDVYSFGIVLWELFCRLEPYEGIQPCTVLLMVLNEGKRPLIPSDCPSDYSKLMKACWGDRPKKRPKFKDIHTTLLKIQSNLNPGQLNKSKK